MDTSIISYAQKVRCNKTVKYIHPQNIYLASIIIILISMTIIINNNTYNKLRTILSTLHKSHYSLQ